MKKRKRIIKGIISYILTLMLTIFFALYMNANVGWFMLVALILAPVLSVFFAFVARFFIKVECKTQNCHLAKNDTCHITVILENKGLFPTPPIEIAMYSEDGVKSQNTHVLATVMPFEKRSFDVNYVAKITGPAIIGVKKVRVTDYLGLFSLPVRKTDYSTLQGKVSVIPEVADVSPRDDKILKVMQASMQGEEGDDTIEVSSNVFGGFPGCDNREYVPGDPIKRVNWKQSAKRGKLLVRLDDVLASKSVNLVLDSTFMESLADMEKLSRSAEYREWSKEDIPAKIKEDAVETALGIIRTLVFSNYTVHFFVTNNGSYEKIDIDDEKDLESLRLMMADYCFDKEGKSERIPKEELLDSFSMFLYCTPNDYKEIFASLKVPENGMSVFSVIGDLEEDVFKENITDKKKVKSNKKEKINFKNLLGFMLIPYLLALLSSVTVFAVFGVSPFSYWTVFQAIVCGLVFALCEYAKRHKFIGSTLISVVILGALFGIAKVAFSGIEYMQWFMSGADSIENTFSYLGSLILIFTLLFSMVLFYYTQVYYRTSAILLVTILPYVVYVKLIREVEIIYVMLAIILNVAAFLMNTRKIRDAGKRVVAYRSGVVSIALYAVCFVLIAAVIPRSENTKYYHFFEEWFLGGNTSVPVPEEYGDKNEYSGNADGFNQLTNRQLYTISDADMSENLYLRRQVFDYYDFENHRWYDDDSYSSYIMAETTMSLYARSMSNTCLIRAMQKTEELSPGFLKKYGLENLNFAAYTEKISDAFVSARNFESYYLITPVKTLEVNVYNDSDAYMNLHKVYGRDTAAFIRYVNYYVKYISEKDAKYNWISIGGADTDIETASAMLFEMSEILMKNKEEELYETACAFWTESQMALEYKEACTFNNEKISDEVRQLALEITKDCIYDWEKAERLENYFQTAGFVYDLEYDAPDDSVEYFLFESKTGTCSDFASAYVLLARAAGLVVRYTEGFVPSREVSATYEWQYVVRTKSSHAYPEVYIPNYGFTVYEPTVASLGGGDNGNQTGFLPYAVLLVIRVMVVLCGVALAIVVILIICRIIAPAILERYFLFKVSKKDEKQAIIMLYKRVLEKYTAEYIKEPFINTPYEYSVKFEELFGGDISPFVYLVENISYNRKDMEPGAYENALVYYQKIKKTIKEYKKGNK